MNNLILADLCIVSGGFGNSCRCLKTDRALKGELENKNIPGYLVMWCRKRCCDHPEYSKGFVVNGEKNRC